MYAVIKAGSHQYKVSKGDVVEVDFIDGKEGDSVRFDQVMLLAGGKLNFGSPFIPGARVEAIIKKQSRNEKVYAIRYRRRKNSKRITGHRQPMTLVEINSILES